jgi:hypothetical protein
MACAIIRPAVTRNDQRSAAKATEGLASPLLQSVASRGQLYVSPPRVARHIERERDKAPKRVQNRVVVIPVAGVQPSKLD